MLEFFFYGGNMLTYHFDQDNKLMEFHIGEKITAEQYDQVINSFKEDLKKVENVNVIEIVNHWKGIEALALWKDIKFAITEFRTINKKIGKAAVVADTKWIEYVTKIFDPLIDIEIKFFDTNDEDKARAWLNL